MVLQNTSVRRDETATVTVFTRPRPALARLARYDVILTSAGFTLAGVIPPLSMLQPFPDMVPARHIAAALHH